MTGFFILLTIIALFFSIIGYLITYILEVITKHRPPEMIVLIQRFDKGDIIQLSITRIWFNDSCTRLIDYNPIHESFINDKNELIPLRGFDSIGLMRLGIIFKDNDNVGLIVRQIKQMLET